MTTKHWYYFDTKPYSWDTIKVACGKTVSIRKETDPQKPTCEECIKIKEHYENMDI